MNDPMLPLPGLSSASGKPVVVKFDGGLLSSDGGVLALREVEQRLRVADRLAACMIDPRAADQITHSLADVIRFRLLMISAGYEDGNDANALRRDPMFKMALDLSPIDRELCSQSTISRLENLPDVRAVLRMGRAMVDLYCESFATVPKRITLDIDDTFDAAHGGQQLRLFNAHYDEYGFQPIVVFDGEGRFITAVLRPAKRPGQQGDQGLSAPPAARHSRQLASGRDPGARRQPLLRSRGSRLLSRQPARLYPRRRADLDAAPAYRGPGSRDEDAVRDHPREWQSPTIQGILRRGRELEPRRTRDRPRRGRRAGAGHALRRHQSATTQRPSALRGRVLPARPGREPHQILEDPPGGGPHVMHQGQRQPTAAVPARRRLLDHVGPARVDAEAFDVACGAVRHLAPAPDQNCRTRRRDEDDDPRAPADIVSGATHFPLCARTNPASRNPALRHLTGGA